MTGPVVSVVIPTYNRASLLPRAIESVIAQTVVDWELVLVDDGSTDGTPELVESFASRLGDRWVYLRQQNRGASGARNRGIDAARGEFVAFLDSDDEFAPQKLEKQLELFRGRPDLGLVYSDYAIIDEVGRALGTAFDTKFPLARTVWCQAVTPTSFACNDALFETLLRGYFVSTITGLVRRSVLRNGIRFSESHSYAEEWLFFLEVARATRAGFVDEPLSIHHYTPQSLARADKHRNLMGMRSLLQEMLRRFPDVRFRDRRSLHVNLSRVCRQLAKGASKESTTQALGLTVEALIHEPRLSTLRECAGIAWQTLKPAAGASSSEITVPPQARVEAVR